MSNLVRPESLKKRQRSLSHDRKEEGFKGYKRKDAAPTLKPYKPNEANAEIKKQVPNSSSAFAGLSK